MDTKLLNQLIHQLKELTEELGIKQAKRLDTARLERIINRLASFADCQECNSFLSEWSTRIVNLKSKVGLLEKQDIKEYQGLVNRVISHLQKEHKLVVENFYMGTYMSLGIAIGYAVGYFLLDDYIIGMSLGLLFGIAIGTSMDANAKKKGLTI